VDWLAAGLPTERSGPGKPRAVDVLDRSVPTCKPGEAVKEVTARVGAAGWDSCIVMNERQIVLGRLRLDSIDHAAKTAVEDVTERGPSTVRPDADVRQTAERLRARRIPDIIVTTPDGELVGVLHANDR
jgi:CBS domain-containing protein